MYVFLFNAKISNDQWKLVHKFMYKRFRTALKSFKNLQVLKVQNVCKNHTPSLTQEADFFLMQTTFDS